MENVNFLNILNILFGSGVLIALIRHFFKIYNEDISKERIKWREKIRKLSQEIVCFDGNRTEAYKLYASLHNRLNPRDEDDQDILKKATIILKLKEKEEKEKKSVDELKEEFITLISLLLKDDWERSKFESSLISLIPLIKYKNNRKIEESSCNLYLRRDILYWILFFSLLLIIFSILKCLYIIHYDYIIYILEQIKVSINNF